MSKWVEVVPCRVADHRVVLKFLKENIFSRFGVLEAIPFFLWICLNFGGGRLCVEMG